MEESYVLMILKQSLPTNIGQEIDFDSIGGKGCLLVFDSLESLRKISPNGEYVKIQSCMYGKINGKT